jgi:phasin family protein
MSLLSLEQFAAAQRANLDTLFGLADKVVDGVEKLTAVNLKMARALLTQTQDSVLEAMSATEHGQSFARQATPAVSIPEHVQSYQREVFDILSGLQAEFARLAQAQCEAYSRRAQTLVDDLAKSAPAGSEPAVAAWKSAMDATSTLVDTVQKSYHQAAEFVEGSIAAASSQTATTIRRGAEKASATVKP